MEPTSVLKCPKCGGTHLTRRGNHSGKPRWRCGSQKGTNKPKWGCGWHGTMPVGREEADSVGVPREHADKLAAKVKKDRPTRRYVVTAAQNATPVWKPFFASLLSYCESTGAELLVIPYRYKNPTSMWTAEAKHDDWWAPELAKYLIDERIDLHKYLTLLADVKTQPTATSPLMGFETLTGPKSAIVGHPKLELLTVPTPQSRMPKILTTTGAVTEKNYIPGKAGKKAEHHHTYGACVVELDEGLFHLRQINAARDGSFCDLEFEYSPVARRVRKTVAGLVLGDTHEEFKDPAVDSATFIGSGSIVSVLCPDELVWHDILDFYSRNHHHQKEFFTNFAKYHAGRDNVREEVWRCFNFVNARAGHMLNVFVSSNHPDALARWVKDTDPRTDPENCVFWAETFKVMCEGTKMGDSGAQVPDPFVYWGQKMLLPTVSAKFLGSDESHEIKGIEVGMHGDRGPNGSRGSIRSFGKIGAKSVVGHSHSPGIKDGVYQVGTSSRLRLEYNRGPSSWLNTHCVIYGNGKRTLVNIVDGKWRARPSKKK